MGITPEQIQLIEDFTRTPDTDDKQRTRAFFQGLSLGFADEIEAFGVSAWDSIQGGDLTYEKARDEIRAKLDKYNKEHPTESLNYELLGALAPTAASLLLTGGTTTGAVTAPLAKKVGSKMLSGRSLGVAGGIGGATAYGTGEEGAVEDLARVPVGTAFGTLSTAVASPLINVGGIAVDKVMGFINSKFGSKVSDVVSKEVNKLAEQMNLLPEEVVRKVANGEIMATNQTLESVMRALRTENPDLIGTALKNQTKKAKEEALESIREELVPGVTEKNIFKKVKQDEAEFKADENKMYKNVFDNATDVTGEIVDSITEAIRRLPDAKTTLDKIYKARGDLVPFYKISDNGAIKIVRMPTLEDAEVIRRTLAETVRSEYKGGSGQVATSLDKLEKKLRGQLDEFSIPLKNVRQKAKIYRGGKDMFDLGRKLLQPSQNVDEIAMIVEKIAKSPRREDIVAFRSLKAGYMDAIIQRTRRIPSFFNKLATEGSQEQDMLRTIFRGEKIEDVIDKIRIAGESRTAYQRILFGSPTAPQQRAESILGMGGVAARAKAGDPSALLDLTSRVVNRLQPSMNQAQRKQLTEILVSSNPKEVSNALFNEGGIAKLKELINRITNVGTRMGVGASIPAGEYGANSMQGLINSMGQ